MGTMTSMWAEVEPVMRERAYRRLDNDPQVLLEHDGGPLDIKADVILARLIGFEDEIVQDAVRLSSVMPVYRLPLLPRGQFAMSEDTAPPSLNLRAAEYVLQSGYVAVNLAPEYAPPEITVGPPTFTFKVLYLRYRRRV